MENQDVTGQEGSSMDTTSIRKTAFVVGRKSNMIKRNLAGSVNVDFIKEGDLSTIQTDGF